MTFVIWDMCIYCVTDIVDLAIKGISINIAARKISKALSRSQE